jgi:hypothetical protein
MDMEQRKLVAMRERGEARRDRFLNARQRTIGVDVEARAFVQSKPLVLELVLGEAPLEETDFG